MEKWIWLSEEKYPDRQTTIYSGFESTEDNGNYTVAEFRKKYEFDDEVMQAFLHFSGDTEFQLFLNGEILATGPVSVGGDFLFNDLPRSKHYASEITVYPHSCVLEFFARVKMKPVGINEYSRGRGGFTLFGVLRFKSGRVKYITTDKSWLAKRNCAYVKPGVFDLSLDTQKETNAAEVVDIWHCETAPIKLRTEKTVYPKNAKSLEAFPGETKTFYIEFDRIYAGFVAARVQTHGEISVKIECIETEAVTRTYELKFDRSGEYRGFRLNSIGACRVTVENRSDETAKVNVFLIETHYPVYTVAKTVTSDKELNLVFDVCRHTLKSCRQMIHLDSPMHSEPLACTGDYYIESLMTSMSFGDMSLAEFDIVRTAEMLRMHDGRMFHTTYSLIWVLMLKDVYYITGNKKLLTECADALSILLQRFEGYIGENGLIETPPDFMFVDWIYIDGISMHHPPKALGQTCLCAFYYAALKAAEEIYGFIGEEAESAYCAEKAEKIKAAINKLLYDEEKGLYFDGLNTPSPEEMLYEYLPQNIEKRYYMPHSNILCAAFGVCDDERAKRLISRVVEDKEWGACQPYFKHFLFEAIFKLGLCEKYTVEAANEWKKFVLECPKGLTEGFIKPEPTYGFDHSHAWGGTVLYSLPKALTGLEILEAGYKKIRLSPNLCGLESARVEIPTPFGFITVELKRSGEIRIDAPKEIEIIM